ncbi:DUF58 domain-containing protein [Bacillus safensis]|uniref:DUF58 domain-containing protein n=1 Tax=Bacillus safensis TaxID=561879 RepID=UPI00203A7E11|nr:DUF58 domain-containing protein [Bacillus safensis]MCM2987417.1 DUF58 domain-containing protein [Bacillus safensis]MCY7448192.1 DUF58 domain-containing protein [Bacillus safensis]MCY7459109.1 DUF58 domain-containing protein [Bacillus safensis]
MKSRHRLAVSLWLRVMVLIILTAAAFCYAMFQGGFVSWFLFYAFLPYALYALLFALVPLRATAKRTIQQTRLKAGDVLSVDLEIKRTHLFPYIYVMIEDAPPDTFHLKEQIEMKKMLFPWFRKTWRFSYQLNDVIRGEHHLTAVRIKTGDMFGFVEKEIIIPLEKKLLVYPKVLDIPVEPAESVSENGGKAVHSWLNEPAHVTTGVREYQQGDRFAWVDWKTTARRGQLMTKEFEQDQAKDLVVFADFTDQAVFETVVSITASVLQMAVKKGVPSGLVPLGDQHAFRVDQGELHLQDMIYYLTRVQQQSSRALEYKLLAASEYQHSGKYVVTGHLQEELAASLFGNRNRKNITVLLVKKAVDRLTTKEKQLVDRLKASGIRITLLFEDRLHERTVR